MSMMRKFYLYTVSETVLYFTRLEPGHYAVENITDFQQTPVSMRPNIINIKSIIHGG